MGNSKESPTVLSCQISDADISIPVKFSEFLTCPIFLLVVGNASSKKFLLHSKLLAVASDRLAKDVQGGFAEESERKIALPEEDPDLFGYFVEYIYRGGWLEKKGVDHESEYVVLARLYALGERLQAQIFQSVILRKFASWDEDEDLADQAVCDLLEIACTELPERVNEDPLRAQIFWYAACRLERLQKYDNFRRLLETHEALGRFLCMRAGDSSESQPKRLSRKPSLIFRPESFYPVQENHLKRGSPEAMVVMEVKALRRNDSGI